MTTRWFAACAVAFALALAGCTSKEQKTRDAVAKHKGAIAAKIAAIDALAGGPFPKPEEKIAAPPDKLVHDKSVTLTPSSNNLYVTPLEDLGHLDQPGSAKRSVLRDYYPAIAWANGLAKFEPALDTAERVEAESASFDKVRYVLILKTDAQKLPEIVKVDGGKDSFKAGLYSGEAHLFGIDGKRYGAVSFTASSSEKVQWTDRAYRHDETSEVESDLRENAMKAMKAAVNNQLPGVMP